MKNTIPEERKQRYRSTLRMLLRKTNSNVEKNGLVTLDMKLLLKFFENGEHLTHYTEREIKTYM